MRRRKRLGASRFEILVMVGIGAVILGTSGVGIVRARVEAQRAECRNNLRQIHTALLSYVEYEGRYPGPKKGAPQEERDAWRLSEALGVHCHDKAVFVCPADTITVAEDASNKGSYRYNTYLSRRSVEHLEKDRLAKWDWLVRDRHLVHGIGKPKPTPPPKPRWDQRGGEDEDEDEEKPKESVPDLRANVLFFDGRVK